VRDQEITVMKIVMLAILLLSNSAGRTRAEPVPDTLASDLRATIASANQAFIRAVRFTDPAQSSPHFSGDTFALSKSIERAKEAGTGGGA
jgi:hypothetical protein